MFMVFNGVGIEGMNEKEQKPKITNWNPCSVTMRGQELGNTGLVKIANANKTNVYEAAERVWTNPRPGFLWVGASAGVVAQNHV
jgi:hypothetical protein